MKKRKQDAQPAPSIAGAELEETQTELVEIGSLRSHPRNYKKHPDAQLAHTAETMRLAGVYKNIVIARDGTILMGHGVVEAARRAGRARISARRLDVDPNDPRALKLLVADNEIGGLADSDADELAALVRSVSESDAGLLGMGVSDADVARMLRSGDDNRRETTIPETHSILVQCKDEAEQVRLLETFQQMGLSVKALLT